MRQSRVPVVFASLVALALALLPALPVAAKGPLTTQQADAVRAFVTQALDELNAPGAAVVIVGPEGIEFAEGFGTARDDGTKVTPQTPFAIASLSKELTAIAVLQLIKSGDLRLDATVHSYLDWFGAAGSDTAKITVRDLLGHTSGWSEAQGLTNRVDEHNDDGAIERNARRLAAEPLAHPIGQWEYSNANYDVLGYLVSVVSGESYEAYMTDHVLGPLAMEHTYLTDAAGRSVGLAQGHYPFFGIPVAYDIPWVRSSLPSSFIEASAEDLGHVLIAHLNNGMYEGKTVLSGSSERMLRQPLSYPDQNSWYGWGWWTYPLWGAGGLSDPSAGGPRYEVPIIMEHGGSHATYASGMLLVPDAGIGVVVLMNLNDEAAPSRFYQVHTGIAQTLLDKGTPALTSYDSLERQYAKVAGVLLVLGMAWLVAWSIRRQRRWADESRQIPRGVLRIAWRVVPPLVLCMGVVVASWWLVLSNGSTNSVLDIWRIARLAPDIGIALLVLTLLGLGWPVVGTIWSWRLLRHREG